MYIKEFFIGPIFEFGVSVKTALRFLSVCWLHRLYG